MESKPLSTGKIIGLSLLGVFVVFVLWAFSSYNTLVGLDENAKTAQANIEVQYQRRFDLIPNLVSTAEGLGNLEKGILENLAEARTRYAGTTSGSQARVDSINQVEGALSRLLVVMENYPQLKSSEAFLKLQDQLEGTENRIATVRTTYNDVVNELNRKIRSFPAFIVARLAGFEQRARFESQVEAKASPEVKFDFK